MPLQGMNHCTTKVMTSKIYPKLPCHFTLYVKGWTKNQDRYNAEIASGANQLSSALEHVQADYQSQPIFETCPLNEPLIETTDNDNDSDWAPDENETTGLEIVGYTGTQNQSLSQGLT